MAAVPKMKPINNTAVADPRAQFWALWNMLATSTPIIVPCAPPSSEAVM